MSKATLSRKKKAKKYFEKLDVNGNLEHACYGGNKKYSKVSRPETKRQRRGF